MKVETTNLTSLPLCLTVIGIRTREIAVQVRDRNLYTTNRQNENIISFQVKSLTKYFKYRYQFSQYNNYTMIQKEGNLNSFSILYKKNKK